MLRDGEPWLAYGTPGGDQQEQWALHVLVRHVDRGLNLQEAIDAPEWHTDHLISSFYPRELRAALAARSSRAFGDEWSPTCGGAATTSTVQRRLVARPRQRRRARGRPAAAAANPRAHAGLRRRGRGCNLARASIFGILAA